MYINSPEGPRLHVKAPWWNTEQPLKMTVEGWYMEQMRLRMHCRLDVRMTNLEEVKHAAYLFDELSKQLASMAFEGQADDILRLLAARSAMKDAQHKFLMKGKRHQPSKHTTRSVRENYKVWRLNMKRMQGQAIENKGVDENEG